MLVFENYCIFVFIDYFKLDYLNFPEFFCDIKVCLLSISLMFPQKDKFLSKQGFVLIFFFTSREQKSLFWFK